MTQQQIKMYLEDTILQSMNGLIGYKILISLFIELLKIMIASLSIIKQLKDKIMMLKEIF